jgi:hypothetical protein
MNKHLLFGALLVVLFGAGCTKAKLTENLSTPAVTNFTKYVIPQGEHYAIGNAYKPVDVSEMAFTVRFDSSCIYQTKTSENQADINKLYGFSDNGAAHQDFSARLGWRWSEGALRLFAYTYNRSARDSKELAVVPIGQDIHCAIKVAGSQYTFTVNKTTATMPRLSTTPTGKGYQLYPYFGGDEAAPHEIRIWIKDLAN